MFFRKIAHKKLTDVPTARIPPCDTNQKSVRSSASRQPGGFRIEKKPFFWILQRGARFARDGCIARGRKQLECCGGGFCKFRSGEPVGDREVLVEMIFGNASAKEAAEGVFFGGRSNRRGPHRHGLRGLQRGESCEFIGSGRHQAHNLSRIARADSFARGARSPAGPTQEGQPCSQGHAAMSSRVFCTRNSCVRKRGSEKPMPPG